MVQTYQESQAGGQRRLILKPGANAWLAEPEQKAVFIARPIPRPFPRVIRELVARTFGEVQKIAESCKERPGAAEQPLRDLARRVCDDSNVRQVVVDGWRDLYAAYRQAIRQGGPNLRIEDWRHGKEPRDIGSWLLVLNVAEFYGLRKIDIIDACSDHPEIPLGVFETGYRKIDAAVKAGDSRWNFYLQRGFGAQAENRQGVCRPKRLGFMQAFVYGFGGVDVRRTGQSPEYAVVKLKTQLVGNLEGQMNSPVRPGDQLPEDFINGFRVGSLVSEQSPMWYMYDQTFMSQQHQAGGSGGQGAFAGAGGKGGRAAGGKANYVVDLSRAPQDCITLSADVSETYFRDWDSLLYIPTREQAWEHFLDAMDEISCAFCGQDEIDLLPKSVRDRAAEFKKLAGTLPVQAPGFTPPGPGGGGGFPPAGAGAGAGGFGDSSGAPNFGAGNLPPGFSDGPGGGGGGGGFSQGQGPGQGPGPGPGGPGRPPPPASTPTATPVDMLNAAVDAAHREVGQ
jgi:hypothetical protein